jgi:Dolichyl-phosphate-mannose-protein mannosyltransferase
MRASRHLPRQELSENSPDWALVEARASHIYEKVALPSDQNYGTAVVLVFLFGALLRLALALVNLEANDNHLEVIAAIADENRLPGREEMWEGFQPKLYHVAVAAVWKTLSGPSLPMRTRAAQLVSCAAGIVTLWLALMFLKSHAWGSPKVGCWSFALVALNPGLIGINAQATNDSFVILFVTLALYSGYHFFAKRRARDFIGMTTAAILAPLSKGNGLVVCMAILLVFIVAPLRGRSSTAMTRGQALLYGAIFLVCFVLVVPGGGLYWEHYRRYGTPFVNPIPPAPFPNVFEKTFVYKPGVTSMIDSLVTFRLYDLLRNPMSTTDEEKYPLHRTSLWSQLYGRAHFAHFDAWPPSWRLPTEGGQWVTSLVQNLGRLIFLAALFPTTLLLVATWKRSVSAIRWFAGVKQPHTSLGNWLLYLSVLGYLAFIVVYSLRYRDYAVMKAIFILPGLLGFLMLFAHECAAFYQRFTDKEAVRLSADLILLSLLFFYTVDILVLIGQLGI